MRIWLNQTYRMVITIRHSACRVHLVSEHVAHAQYSKASFSMFKEILIFKQWPTHLKNPCSTEVPITAILVHMISIPQTLISRFLLLPIIMVPPNYHCIIIGIVNNHQHLQMITYKNWDLTSLKIERMFLVYNLASESFFYITITFYAITRKWSKCLQ